MPVRDFLKSLSATYRNRCPGLSETRRQWVFLSDQAVLHKISKRRARQVAEGVLGGHQPDVWVSDR
ncbi:hypothetical protein ABIC78_004249, partial [Novosphingobium sp. 1529]|uniref:hypothetical protein n=1 Tax=Novosphingobium sp. 1529 TaxID=3156424 RepID=UPI00339ADC72